MNNLFHLAGAWLPHAARDELIFSSQRHALFKDFTQKAEIFNQNQFNSLYEFTDGFFNKFGDMEGLEDVYLISKEF